MIFSRILNTAPKIPAPSLDQRAFDFLRQHTVGVLSTVDVDNNPHAAAIYFAVEPGTLEISFLTRRHTKKCDNLTHNNHAMIAVFDADSQTTVQITGIATEVEDATLSSRIFRNTLRASLHRSQSAVPPVVKLQAGQFVAYRLRPSQVRLSSYAHPDVRGPGVSFQTINLPH